MTAITQNGQKKQVANIDDVCLDFSGLFNSAEANNFALNDSLIGSECNCIANNKNALNRKIEPLEKEQSKQLYLEVTKEKEAYHKHLKTYEKYQENIKNSAELETEILKGISSGENIYSLFLKATKAISLMTNSDVFFDQIKSNMIVVYGLGLHEQEPLHIEIREIKERLQKLRQAETIETNRDNKKRISNAIKAHENALEHIQYLINETQQ